MKRTTLSLTFAVLALFGASAKADLITSFNLDTSSLTAPASTFQGIYKSTGGPATLSLAKFESMQIVAGSPVGFFSTAGPAQAGQSADFTSNPDVGTNKISISFDPTGFSNLQLTINYSSLTGPNAFALASFVGGNLISSLPESLPSTATYGTFSTVTFSIAPGTTLVTLSNFSPSGAGPIAFDNISVTGTKTGIVPEPVSIALPLFGAMMIGMVMFRRRNGASEDMEMAAV